MNFSHFYENFFGGEYGSSIDRISARGVGICERGFPSLEENFTLKNILIFLIWSNIHEI